MVLVLRLRSTLKLFVLFLSRTGSIEFRRNEKDNGKLSFDIIGGADVDSISCLEKEKEWSWSMECWQGKVW